MVDELTLILDGFTVPEDEHSLTSFSLTKQTNNQNDFTSDITFTGRAREIIIERLVNVNQPQVTELELLIFWEGELQIIGSIKGNGIEFNEGVCTVQTQCEITAKITEQKNQLDFLKEHLMFVGLPRDGHPLIRMNQDVSDFEATVASILQVLVIITTAFLLPTILLLFIIVPVLNAIISAVNTLPFVNISKIDFDQNPDNSLFESLKNFVEDLILGLDRIHTYPSPYVRDYIENALTQVGTITGETYNFVSSIWNNPNNDYFNTVYFNAPIVEGHISGQTTLIEENDVVLTFDSFMRKINAVFNTEWHLIGNTLFVEPKEFFDNLGTTYPLDNYCGQFSVSTQNYPARLKIAYPEDFLDQSERYFIVDYNTPPNNLQKGQEELILEFGWHKIEDFKGLFGGKNLGVILKIDSAKTTVLPKLLLVDNQGELLEDQSPFEPENLAPFHATKDPRNEVFKHYTVRFENLPLCDFDEVTQFDKFTFQGLDIDVSEVRYNYLPDKTIEVDGKIGRVKICNNC